MRLDLELTIGPLTIVINTRRPEPPPLPDPPSERPTLEATGGGQNEISDQLPLGFGPSLATRQTTRY